MSPAALRRLVLALNTLGVVAYLGWLVFSRERILYTPLGVLYVLPALPFLLVYLALGRRPPSAGDDDPD